jgi:hypothetical protein
MLNEPSPNDPIWLNVYLSSVKETTENTKAEDVHRHAFNDVRFYNTFTVLIVIIAVGLYCDMAIELIILAVVTLILFTFISFLASR